MDGLEWMSDVVEPEVLGEEDVFDMHMFCKIKYIHHRLPSGEYTHIRVGGKKFIMGIDPVSTTGTFNMRVSKTRDTSSTSTKFINLW